MSSPSRRRPRGNRHLHAGAAAEAAAAHFLQSQGLPVLARNVRMQRGEIDLIARDGATLVFCEVRWRASAAFGGALASIDARKRARLRLAVRCFLAGLDPVPPCRIDALCADGGPPYHWIWVRGL